MKPDSSKDYYRILDIDADATRSQIDRQFKRQASKCHPDLGGSEEQMKSLNEAYGVLKDETQRREYDRSRATTRKTSYVPATTPTAHDVGIFGHCLSSLLCLMAGFFLLVLVRFQWIWFLWPLAILAVFVLGFGVFLARSAMIALNGSLPTTNRLKRHTRIQEFAFWTVIVCGVYGIFWLMG